MLSDSLHDAYMTILEALVRYSQPPFSTKNADYPNCQKANIIEALTRINMSMAAYSRTCDIEGDYYQGGRDRAVDIANFDYNKAINGIEYGSGSVDKEWSNHDLYDSKGNKKK